MKNNTGEVAIIKMKNNDTIIGIVSQDEADGYLIESPILFYMYHDEYGRSSLIMRFWLPENMIENNVCVLYDTDFITMVMPTEEFVDYYLQIITQLEKDKEHRQKAFSRILQNGIENLVSRDAEDTESEDESQEEISQELESQEEPANIFRFPKIDKNKLN